MFAELGMVGLVSPSPPHPGGHRVCGQVSSPDSLAAPFSVHCFLPFPFEPPGSAHSVLSLRCIPSLMSEVVVGCFSSVLV